MLSVAICPPPLPSAPLCIFGSSGRLSGHSTVAPPPKPPFRDFMLVEKTWPAGATLRRHPPAAGGENPQRDPCHLASPTTPSSVTATSCALVSRAGSVDFLCWPRFDSDACFAALLGDDRHGTWTLAPADPATATRRYRDGTAILETEHRTEAGRVRVTDFMAWIDQPRSLVRIVEGLDGTVPMQMLLRLRFSYGRVEPWTHKIERGLCAEIGPDRVLLTSSVEIDRDGTDGTASFSVRPGQRLGLRPHPLLVLRGHATRAGSRKPAPHHRARLARLDRPLR